jgi:eukaryotic-like serine/threonine-protein kinase
MGHRRRGVYMSQEMPEQAVFCTDHLACQSRPGGQIGPMPPEEPTLVSGGTSPPPSRAAHPGRIGPFRIVRVLGEGGMGTVYEAEQLEPLRRTVALKVIRRGMDTDEVLARFESERQALAVMDHPNIARALDAGTTDEGLPYFVMELVAGEPITAYCDRHDLDLRRRLQLFVGVCRGVQHAHQKGVIHRDLKPSNILVRVTDGQPVPTIIDFGIAKAIERRLAADAFATGLGVMVGTPAYMSPEQAEASGLDIDTRADIYSLGMVLYELVTGVLPFDFKGLLPAPLIAKYVLGNAEVPRPSRRIAGLEPDTATASARHRHTTPVGLRRELRGDLDWIVVKAIERDRNRRYETATALALDLERHLEHKPVSARPPTLGYTATRFVRRHRLGVSVLVTAVAVLLVAIVSIARERNRAEREGAKAQAISGFLQDMLKSADPWEGGARQTTVVDALRSGVKQLDAGGIPDPIVAASVRRTIGSVYLSFGRFDEADTLLRAVLAQRLARGRPDAETAESWADPGGLFLSQRKFDSAGVALERALALRRDLLGPGDTLVAASLLDLADLATGMGQLRRADSLAQEALAILRAAHGDRHPAIARTMSRIAGAYLGRGDYGRTDSIARPAIAMLRKLGLGRSPQITGILNDLALSRMFQGDYQEASALMHEVLAIDSSLYGSSHPFLAMHLENMAMVYDYLGFADSNVMVLNQTLAMRRAVLPEDSPDIGRTLFNLGSAEYLRGNYEAAEPLYEESLARMRRAYGPLHPDIVWATATLGRNQYRLGRRAEAERNLRWALGVTDPDGRLDPPAVARAGQELVALYLEQRRWAEAEPLALRVLGIRDSMGDTLARRSAAQLAEIYKGKGQDDLAAKYRSRAE